MELMGRPDHSVTYKIEGTKMTFQHIMVTKHVSCPMPFITVVLRYDSRAHEYNSLQ